MIASARIAVIVVALVLLSLALLPVQILARRASPRLSRALPRLWHRAACRLVGLRVRVRGAPSCERPLLLVANHVSWADIPALGSVAPLSFVAKAEVRGWPVFGWLARLQGCVFVDRADRRGAGRQADALGQRLSAGEAMVLFAEGTTSDGNEVRPFNPSLLGAAEASLKGGTVAVVHVQPVALAYVGVHGLPLGRFWRPLAAWTGDADLLPHLLAFLRAGTVEVEVAFGEPIAFTPGMRRRTVAGEAERAVRRLLSDGLSAGPAVPGPGAGPHLGMAHACAPRPGR